MVRTLGCHCWGPVFHPWVGDKDLASGGVEEGEQLRVQVTTEKRLGQIKKLCWLKCRITECWVQDSGVCRQKRLTAKFYIGTIWLEILLKIILYGSCRIRTTRMEKPRVLVSSMLYHESSVDERPNFNQHIWVCFAITLTILLIMLLSGTGNRQSTDFCK